MVSRGLISPHVCGKANLPSLYYNTKHIKINHHRYWPASRVRDSCRGVAAGGDVHLRLSPIGVEAIFCNYDTKRPEVDEARSNLRRHSPIVLPEIVNGGGTEPSGRLSSGYSSSRSGRSSRDMLRGAAFDQSTARASRLPEIERLIRPFHIHPVQRVREWAEYRLVECDWEIEHEH